MDAFVLRGIIGADLSELNSALSQAKSQVASSAAAIEGSFKGMGTSIGTAVDRLQDLRPALDKFGSDAQGAGLAITASITAPMVLAVKAAGDFDSAMRKVTSLITDVTEKDFQDLREQTLALSTSMGVDAVKSADALYQAISSGIPKENAVDFLRIATTAAIAGVTDTRVAVDGLTTVIQAFGLQTSEAKAIADAMFQAVNVGKLEFPELSKAIGIAAGTAHALGVSYQELLGAGAALTLTTGQSISQAMTMLESAMKAVIKPTKDMKVLIEETGFSSGKALIEAKGLEGGIRAINDAAGGSIDVLAKAYGRVEGLRGSLGLTGDNAKKAAEVLGDMSKAADGLGASTNAANEINKGFNRQLEMFETDVKNVAIQFGTALLPALKELMDDAKPLVTFIGDMVTGFQAMPGPVKAAGEALLGVFGVTGPLLLGVGTFARSISDIIGLMKLFKTAEAVTEATQLTTAITGVGTAVSGSGGLAAILGIGGLALASFGAAAIATSSQLSTLELQYKDLNDTLERKKIMDLLATGKTVDDLAKLGISLDQIKKATDNGSISGEKFKSTISTLGITLVKTTGNVTAHTDATKKLTTETDKAGDSAKKHTDALKSSGDQLQSTTSWLDQYARTAAQGGPIVDYLSGVQGNLSKVLGDGQRALAAITSQIQPYITLIDELGPTLDDASGAQRNLNRELLNGPAALRAITGDIKPYDDALEQAGKDALELGAIADGVWNESTGVPGKQKKGTASAKADLTLYGQHNKSIFEEIAKDVESSMKRGGDDIAKLIVDGNLSLSTLGDAFKKTFADIATKAIGDFIELGLHVLFKELGKLLDLIPGVGSALGGIFGSGGSGGVLGTGVGAATGAGGAAAGQTGGIAGAVSQGVSSGLTGIVTAVSSAVSAVTGVVSIFQNMHQETSLNAIEHNTRYSMEYLGERGDGGILGILFKIDEELAFGFNTKSTEQMRDYIAGPINQALSDINYSTHWSLMALDSINGKLDGMAAVMGAVAQAPTASTSVATTAQTANSASVTITNHFNGPVVGGQRGLEELSDTVGNIIVDRLRQARIHP